MDNGRASITNETIGITFFGILLALGIIKFFFFGFGNYNQKDLLKVDTKNQYVYGDGPEQPARQTKNTYTSDPANDKRATQIRDKFFPKKSTSDKTAIIVVSDTTTTGPAKTDTTVK